MADLNDLSVDDLDPLDAGSEDSSESAQNSDASNEDSDLDFMNEESQEEPEEEDEDEDDEETHDDEPKKKSSGFKKRIDGLIKKNAELEERLAKFEQSKTTTEEKKEITEPSKLVKPKFEDFDSFDDYSDALESYLEDKVLSKVKGLDSEKAEAEKVRLANESKQQEDLKYIERANQVAESTYKDFNEVVESLMKNAKAPSEHAIRYMIKSEFGPYLSYYLGKNIAKANELAAMSVEDQIKFLSKTEERIAAKVSVKKENAPAPLNRVKPKATASKKSYKDYNVSTEDFIKMRNEQKGIKR